MVKTHHESARLLQTIQNTLAILPCLQASKPCTTYILFKAIAPEGTGIRKGLRKQRTSTEGGG
eukprot:5957389-Alexandrium_andersonii.AAC.1